MKKPKLPRVPLPRQTGGFHTPKTKRKPKHRKPLDADLEERAQQILDDLMANPIKRIGLWCK